jgi:hypothetical protein
LVIIILTPLVALVLLLVLPDVLSPSNNSSVSVTFFYSFFQKSIILIIKNSLKLQADSNLSAWSWFKKWFRHWLPVYYQHSRSRLRWFAARRSRGQTLFCIAFLSYVALFYF